MNVAELIDIGANLTHESFRTDRTEVIARAVAAGVRRLVVTGADLKGSRAAAALAQEHDNLWSTAGIHPHHAAEYDAGVQQTLLELLSESRVVAVGECGLDYFRDLSPRDKQRAAFLAQLELAVRVGKPVFLHQRDAHQDFSAILKDFPAVLKGGVAHCFTGGREELDAYLGLGLSIGVTGWLNDERRGQALRAALPFIPDERLMIETDAPYLLPRDLQGSVKGRRNEPYLLAHVARTVAQLRAQSFEQVARITTANAERFFGLAG